MAGYREEAFKIVFRRKCKAEEEAQLRHDRVAAEHPELIQLEQQMAQTAMAGVRAAVAGRPADEVKRCRDQNLALQEQRGQLLQSLGLPVHCFEPQYHCARCQDTGRADGKVCSCVRQLEREMLHAKLNQGTPLEQSAFQNFSLEYYEDTPDETGLIPRKRMGEILTYCERYAAAFDRHAKSLLLAGATGLGKTHLSLAIAGAVTQKGYSALYGSAQNFLAALEREHFGKSDADTQKELLACDLLVLDDLGAEFTTPFVTAAIYNLINTRLLHDVPTIISTNLTLAELEKRYGERVVSRLIGCYDIKKFVGGDVRVKKKMLK